ncbi:hypothetical protein [Rhizobium rhizosphaerae]|nr:hypothetical protein [Xaviernesmea rhizosphaerae]
MIELASGFPVEIVARVVDRFRHGAVKGQSLVYPPSLPLLAEALRDERPRAGEPGYESPRDYRRKLIEQNRVAAVVHSEAEKRAVRMKLQQFHAQRGIAE